MTTKEKLWKLYEGKCSICGHQVILQNASIDHVLPKSKGGKNSMKNYALTHKKCNNKKGNKIIRQNVIPFDELAKLKIKTSKKNAEIAKIMLQKLST